MICKDFGHLVFLFLRTLKGDRVLWGLALACLLFLVAIPSLSLFSMRQIKELAVTLALSGTSLFLLVCAVFLGATSIWRDLEKRFAVPVLALPLSRKTFVFSKFAALGIFLVSSVVFLCVFCSVGVLLAGFQQAGSRPVVWVNFVVSFGMLGLKYLLLLALTLVLSALSTSFFLPVFGALAIFMAGSASYQVMQFLLQNPEKFSPVFIKTVNFIHYIIPNFSAFDYQIYAIYGLPLRWSEVFVSFLYGTAYIIVALILASALFERREI